MMALDPFVPAFVNAAIDVYDAAGQYQQRDEYIRESTRLNPDFKYSYAWNMNRLFGNGQIDELRQYIDQIDLSAWTSKKNMHAAIDWMTNSQTTPGDDVLQALTFRPSLAMMAGRPDVFYALNADRSNGEKFPAMEFIINPHLSADETRRVHELPATKAFLQELRLPEYWRQVGWPDMCQPVGEDDFECH